MIKNGGISLANTIYWKQYRRASTTRKVIKYIVLTSIINVTKFTHLTTENLADEGILICDYKSLICLFIEVLKRS